MRRLLRLFAVLGVLALAGGALAACGDDDDGSADGGSTAQTQEETEAEREGNGGGGNGGGGASDGGGDAGPALSGNVEEARQGVESVDSVYEGFGAAVEEGIAATEIAPRETLDQAAGNESLASVCDLMSEEAKRQTIIYARRSAGLADVKWTCENATGLLLRRASQTGGLKRSLRAKVVGVNVEGDRATASVRFGGKGPISTVPMVKEDGEWKLAASPSGGSGGGGQ